MAVFGLWSGYYAGGILRQWPHSALRGVHRRYSQSCESINHPSSLIHWITSGIQAGARSGLSTIVSGVLFLLSSFMTNFWASIPDTAISTVLLVVGFLFFDRTATVDWKNTKEALPTFTTCIMTAFTCSVLNGAVTGTVMFLLITLTTDCTENMTESLMKNVFRGWNWMRRCWQAEDREHESDLYGGVRYDVVNVHSSITDPFENENEMIDQSTSDKEYYQSSC